MAYSGLMNTPTVFGLSAGRHVTPGWREVFCGHGLQAGSDPQFVDQSLTITCLICCHQSLLPINKGCNDWACRSCNYLLEVELFCHCRQSGHLAPGSRFSEGQTTVTFSATDPRGNSEQCNVLVTVVGKAACNLFIVVSFAICFLTVLCRVPL